MSLHSLKLWPLLVSGFLLQACASYSPPPLDADTFTPEGVLTGSQMTEESCAFEDTSVWVDVGGRGECVRYFQIGLNMEGANPKTIIYFHGDRMKRVWDANFRTITHNVIAYADNSPEGIIDRMTFWQRLAGVPFIQISRPGTYGSSGDHKARRQQREVDIILAAVEAIKEKYEIDKLYIAGQSGGAHSAAAVITNRTDVECGVMSAGILAVKRRSRIRGWPGDDTGYNYYYDPVEHVSEIPESATRRLFVVGDPRDTVAPFTAQKAYFEAVKAAGHDIWLVEAIGRGNSHNIMSHVSRRMIAACAQDESTEQVIVEASH